MSILMAFIVGGFICLLGQLVLDLTPFSVTPAHILVGYVTGGALLSSLGLYKPLVELGGMGAKIPLSGFGHALSEGAIKGVNTNGLLGVFSGGIEAIAAGIGAAVVFGYLMAVIFNPQS